MKKSPSHSLFHMTPFTTQNDHHHISLHRVPMIIQRSWSRKDNAQMRTGINIYIVQESLSFVSCIGDGWVAGRGASPLGAITKRTEETFF